MKKKTKIVLVSICVLVAIIGIALYAFMSSEFYRKEKAPTAWDCSVTCAEESTPNNYVINYTDSKVISKTGVLTIQNRNDFCCCTNTNFIIIQMKDNCFDIWISF